MGCRLEVKGVSLFGWAKSGSLEQGVHVKKGEKKQAFLLMYVHSYQRPPRKNKQTLITRPGHCRTGSGWLINGVVGLMGFSDKNVIW